MNLRAWAHCGSLAEEDRDLYKMWKFDEKTFLFSTNTRTCDRHHLGKDAFISRDTEMIDKNDTPIFEFDYVVVGVNYAPALVLFENGEFVLVWSSRQGLTWRIHDHRIEFLEVVGNQFEGLKEGYKL